MIYCAALILYIMHVVLRRMSDDDDEYRIILRGFVIVLVYGEINSPDEHVSQ